MNIKLGITLSVLGIVCLLWHCISCETMEGNRHDSEIKKGRRSH